MKHSKKWISSALVLSLSVGLSACGNANDKKKGTSGSDKTASTQWAKGDACPKVVSDEYFASESPDTDKMSLDEKIAVYEKTKSLTESFHKKYLGKPGCKVEITSSSGEKVPFEIEFLDQEQLDDLMKARSAHIEGLKKKKTQGSTTGAGSTTSTGSTGSSSQTEERTTTIQQEYLRVVRIEGEAAKTVKRASDELANLDPTRFHFPEEIKAIQEGSLAELKDFGMTIEIEASEFLRKHLGEESCTIEVKDAEGKVAQKVIDFPKDQDGLDQKLGELTAPVKKWAKELEGELEKALKSAQVDQAEDSSAPTKPIAAPANPTAAPANPTAAPANPTAAPANPTAAPAKPAAAPAKPAATPAKPAATPAKPAAAPAKPAATPAKQSTSKAPMCEDALVQDFKKFATSEEANMEGINKNNALAMANKQIDRFESFMKKYVGHPDCMMMEDGKLSLTEFPKSQNELAKLVSDYKKQMKAMVDIVKKL